MVSPARNAPHKSLRTWGAILTILCLCISAFSLFFNLDGRHLEDWDEAIYVKAAEDAVKTGDYLAMRFRDDLLWDKSPFPVFPMMALFSLFGVSELTARLSSALFGLGTLIQIILLARRFYDEWTGLLAVLVTVTTTQFMFWHGVRSADIDSITIFFLTGSISSWLLIDRVWLKIVVTMASLGFCFLCKGPIIGIPVVVILSSLLIHNPLKRSSLGPLSAGLFVFLIITLPWYVYMYGRFGDYFIQRHVLRVFFQWFAVGVDSHVRDQMFLINNVLLSPVNFPWFGLALVSILNFFRRFSEERGLADFVLLAWVFSAFFVVNHSQTKIAWYVFPLYPPLAIMSAKTLVDFVRRPDYLTKAAYYVGLTIVLSFFFNDQVFPHNTTSNAARAGMASTAIFGLVTLLEKRLPSHRLVICTVLVCLLFYVPLKTSLKYLKSRSVSPIQEVADSLDFRDTVYSYEVAPSGIYYLTRKGAVRDFYAYSPDITPLRGRLVVTRTAIITAHQGSGGIRLTVAGQDYWVSPVKIGKEFSIVRFESQTDTVNSAKPNKRL